ncbi:MAG: hypothetical protein FWF10_08130 [Clostridiales bacterium]|nr:hypothetical protein [Clostridiales bacterium]
MKRHLLHSLRSVVRAPWKALVFFVLIACVTAILFLGLGAYAAGNLAIAEGDANYVTIADFQFIGDNYPDASVADEEIADAIAAFPWEEVRLAPGVVSVAPALRMTGVTMKYTTPRQWSLSPYRNHVVLILYCVMQTDHYGENKWAFVLEEALFPSDFQPEDKSAFIFLDDTYTYSGFEFQRGHTYAVLGDTVIWGMERMVRCVNLYQISEATDTDTLSDVLDITDFKYEFLADLPPDYKKLANFLLRENSGLDVIVTHDMVALPEFHQNQIIGNNVGRCSFTEEEVAAAAKVCVITKRIAGMTGLGVGDAFDLTLYEPSTALIGGLRGSASEDVTYTIIGIVEPSEQEMWGNIYVPGTAESYALARTNGYTLGQAVLQNGQGDAFTEYIEPLLPARVCVNIYDQGYASAEKAFLSAIKTGAILALGSLAAFLIVLAVFGLLFAYRQRESTDTMLTLGAKSAWVRLYLCFGAAILAALASAAGAALGYFLSGRLNELLFTRAVNPWDCRYSDSALGLQKDFLQAVPEVPVYLFLLVILGTLLCAILFLLFFSQRAISIRISTRKKKRRTGGHVPQKERRSVAARGGALKYAWLSMTRGGAARFLVSFGACLVLAVFVCAVHTAAVRFAQQEALLYDDTILEGAFSNYLGNSITNTSVQPENVDILRDSGFIRGARMVSRPTPVYPILTRMDDSYFWGWFEPDVLRFQTLFWNKLMLVNDLAAAPEFVNSSAGARVNWAEGWDMERFAAQTPENPRVCLVSERWMQGHTMTDVNSSTIPYFVNEDGEKVFDALVDEDGALLPFELYLNVYEDEEGVFQYYFIETPSGDRYIYRMVVPEPVYVSFGFGTNLTLGAYIQGEQMLYNAEIVGSFRTSGIMDNVYFPAAQHLSRPIRRTGYTDDGYYMEWYDYEPFQDSYNGVYFTLENARDLDAFKGFLAENGFGYPGMRREHDFVYLHDRAFLETRSALARQRNYLENISVLLYGLSVAVSLFLAYLLISGRRTELALMKSVGAGGLRMFFSFFFEQLMLAALAGADGLLICFAIWRALPLQGMMGIGIVCACYVLGCAVSIAAQCRVSVRALFTDE